MESCCWFLECIHLPWDYVAPHNNQNPSGCVSTLPYLLLEGMIRPFPEPATLRGRVTSGQQGVGGREPTHLQEGRRTPCFLSISQKCHTPPQFGGVCAQNPVQPGPASRLLFWATGLFLRALWPRNRDQSRLPVSSSSGLVSP